MGIILAFGLKTTVSIAPVSGMLMLQPQVAFATAFVFIALGIILLKQSILAIKIAHFWIILYIGFSIIMKTNAGKYILDNQLQLFMEGRAG